MILGLKRRGVDAEVDEPPVSFPRARQSTSCSLVETWTRSRYLTGPDRA
jgi:hypothetical protein